MNTITASRFERLALCPGSYRAERDLPDKKNPYGESGQRVHAALAKYWLRQQIPELRPDEHDIATAFINESMSLVASLPDVGPDTHIGRDIHVEKRLESPDGFSGQPDLVSVWGNNGDRGALVLDWKSGWLDQPPSTHNLQLRAYAVLVALNHRAKTVDVALLQRNATTEITRYTAADLVTAQNELRRLMGAALDPYARRVAGETQCRYCRAVGVCPESRETIPEVLSVVGHPAAVAAELDKNTATLVARSLTNEQLAQIRDRRKVVELVLEATDDEIKCRLKIDPKSVPGFALKPGNKRRVIRDAGEAFRLLRGTLDSKEFVQCCSVNIGELEERFKAATGATTAQAKQALSEKLCTVIDEKQNEPSIVRT